MGKFGEPWAMRQYHDRDTQESYWEIVDCNGRQVMLLTGCNNPQ